MGWHIFSDYLKKCEGSSAVFERRKKTLARVFSAVMDDIGALHLEKLTAEEKVKMNAKAKLQIAECCYVVTLKMMADYTCIISMGEEMRKRFKLFDEIEALILKKYLWLF